MREVGGFWRVVWYQNIMIRPDIKAIMMTGYRQEVQGLVEEQGLNMLEKASLLIVDDEEGMLETLSDILQEKGYWTEAAKTGKEAITKAEERFFNVALIDIKLPDMTGIELLRTFRKRYPSRMNIIITGYATLQNAIDALNLGANAYVLKPIDPERLEQMIKECLKRQQEALKITRGALWKKLGRNLRKKQQEGLTR